MYRLATMHSVTDRQRDRRRYRANVNEPEFVGVSQVSEHFATTDELQHHKQVSIVLRSHQTHSYKGLWERLAAGLCPDPWGRARPPNGLWYIFS